MENKIKTSKQDEMINITDIISLIKSGEFLKVVMSVLLGDDVLHSYYGDDMSIYSIDYKT